MNKKSLIFAGLFIALVGCGKSEAPVAVAAAPAAAVKAEPDTTPVVKAPPAAAPAPALSDGPPMPKGGSFSSFQDVSACVSDGWAEEQCLRAAKISESMTLVDNPFYATEAECKAAWKVCKPVDKRFGPAMVAFMIGGEEKGAPAPTVEKPSFYVPLYANAAGRIGYLTGKSLDSKFNEVSSAKIVRSTKQAAPTPAPSSP